MNDVGTVVNDEAQAQTFLIYLNTKHPTIRFEMELPICDGFLPLLDVHLRITADGRVERKLLAKAANKNITLHYCSHHPSHVKKAVVANEFRRASVASSSEH